MRIPLGYQQLTGISSATSPTVPAGTFEMDVSVEAQAVRWRDDGTAPTAAVGELAPVQSGPAPWVYRGNPRAIQFIAQTAGAIVNLSFYGRKN